MPPPPVHRARFAELDPLTAYRLWALRSAVFVVEQDCAYLDLDGLDPDPGTRHLWVEEDGVPVGYLRVLEEGDHVRVGRVVTDPAHRGRGHGARLVAAALADLAERPVDISAQSHLRDWYASFGFEVTGEEFLEDGIAHLPMRRG